MLKFCKKVHILAIYTNPPKELILGYPFPPSQNPTPQPIGGLNLTPQPIGGLLLPP